MGTLVRSEIPSIAVPDWYATAADLLSHSKRNALRERRRLCLLRADG